MWIQAALFAAQMVLGEVTRQRPKRTSFEDFVATNEPDETRPIIYAGGTVQLTPPRMWYGDYRQRAVERDSHWTDYIFLGAFAFLLDAITVAYRSYIGEMFPLCWGPDAHVEQIFIQDRLMFQAALGTDNAGGGFLIDDPQAWGGDQPPGEGGEYAFLRLTRGNYTDPTNAYLESLLTTPPNRTPSLRGISTLVKLGPSGETESGYFHAGGPGAAPTLKEWKVTVRRQPNNLATAFSKIGRGMNPMEVIYEWSTSLEYGAQIPLEYLNLNNWRSLAEDLHAEGNAWNGKIETPTDPGAVVDDVLKQIDAVKDISPSNGLTFRLIRRDYSFPSLRVLDRDVITRVDRFSPGTYEDTVSKVRVEFPDIENNHKDRPALYIDTANELITRRQVPQSQQYLGVSDFEQANEIATREGRAQSLPRAPLECFVMPSWGRLTYRGEVVLFEWSSPTFSIVMRVLNITPNGPDEKDYRLVLIEDQFASGLRTSGEPGATSHVDPGAGLDVAPPSATWNEEDFPPDGLKLTLTLTNTNQFMPVIEGGIIFGSYAPGGQRARLYVTEPGGVQTLSPVQLAPDANNEDVFVWPANAEGVYEFCVQTFSTRGATNGVKVCAEINVTAIGSPSISASASVSPSASVSSSPSPSASVSPSASISPSGSQSASLSPSSSVSPSSGAQPDDFAGLLFWYKPEAITGFSNNDPLTLWPDSSVNANDLTPNVGFDEPLYQTGVLNGFAGVLFDGIDSMLESDVSVETVRHVFAVLKTNATPNFSGFNGALTLNGTGDDRNIILTSHDATNHWYFGTLGVGDPYRSTYKLNGVGDTGMVMAMNAFAVVEVAAAFWGTAGGVSSYELRLGVDRQFSVAGRWWDGHIIEVIGYDEEKTSGDAADIRAYLYDKYGLSGS